jgi:hypothetical protein
LKYFKSDRESVVAVDDALVGIDATFAGTGPLFLLRSANFQIGGAQFTTTKLTLAADGGDATTLTRGSAYMAHVEFSPQIGEAVGAFKFRLGPRLTYLGTSFKADDASGALLPFAEQLKTEELMLGLALALAF